MRPQLHSGRAGLRLLNNLPIATKSLVAPSVSAAVMLGIVALVLVTYRTIEHAEVLDMGLAHAVEQAMDFPATLGRGHTALYRAISLKSQDVDPQIVRAGTEEAREAWDYAGESLSELRDWLRSDVAREALGPAGVAAEAARIEDARGAFAAYLEVGHEAAGFVPVDAFVATMYLNGAEKRYTDAENKVAMIVADLSRRRAQIDQAATNAVRRALYQVGGATGIAILVSLTVALLFARLISGPIHRLTEKMGRLALGDLGVEIHASGRKDEIGRMTAALGTLRNAAIEAERLAHERQHSQKLEALGTMAGGIAHDLNNTLVPVLALTKLTATRLPEGARERSNLETVLRAAERARDLVKQILAFSRKEKVEKQPVDLVSLVRETLIMIRASTPATVQIVPEIDTVPSLIGDAGQLQQVLVNLITNAAQAIGDKIGVITVGLKERATVGGEDRCRAIVLSIADTGAGMDEATRARIFDPFFTTKPVGEGTGLGLSVVHGIVAEHGGRIEVTSCPGAGTRFDIAFAIDPSTSQIPATQSVARAEDERAA